MSFGDMTNEEWEEVRRHHDDMVQMGQLELRAEEIREHPPGAARHATTAVERNLRDLDDMIVSLSH